MQPDLRNPIVPFLLTIGILLLFISNEQNFGATLCPFTTKNNSHYYWIIVVGATGPRDCPKPLNRSQTAKNKVQGSVA